MPIGRSFFQAICPVRLFEADQKAWARVMVPREQHRVVQHQGAEVVPPGHLRIAKRGNVTSYPDQLAVVRVPGNVGIAKGDVDRVFGDRRSIGSEVRLGVRPLVHTETEVVPPQLSAVCPIKAKRQQRFLPPSGRWEVTNNRP